MRGAMRFVMEWKTQASLMFTGSAVLYLCVCLALGETAVEAAVLWSLLLLCAAGSLLQGLCFTELVIKKLRYTGRLALFCGLFLPVIAGTAWGVGWFPMDAGHWAVFLGIFLGVFLVMTAGYEIYFWAVGRRYDGILGQYRRSKEGQ